MSTWLASGAASGASFLVPAAGDRLPGWMAGAFAGAGQTRGHGALLVSVLVLGAGYAVVLACRPALPASVVIGGIVALHVIFLLAPPLLSGDVFSYIAYGRLGALHGISPYRYGPDAAPHDPVLRYVAALWAHTPSAYGPLFTIPSYALGSLGIAAGLWGFKLLAAAAGLAVVAFVWRIAEARGRDPVVAAATVGLNPIFLIYAIGGAHNDLVMLAITMLGVLLACTRREAGGAAAVVAGAAVKASAAVVLPFLLLGGPQPRRAALGGLAAFAAIAALAVAVFRGSALGFASVLAHAHLVTSSSPGSDIMALIGRFPGRRPLGTGVAALVLAGLLWAVWRGADWVAGAGWALLLAAGAGSAMFGWYTIWPLPFAILTSDRRLLWATLFIQVMFVAHLVPDVVA
ncbi:polyprenol phosphomannose-dependent alpha 1,6 mannosyltransferase MptB [Baekduia soli]|uniref:polyprenol phosphomannose-dependent alpha 1,6 mannosyltransferase MptB n=1 Tax=Baekduia soli TaxID=496014 RepID=UPI001651ECB5|nr:polyprenol phosphomannose-dependent alpha 1,6 mannosyltransferase MptB [Baekduia soli]